LDRPLTLSAQLRTSSRSAHIAVEEAFDLDVRLADLRTYAHLLGVLRDVYGAAEDALGMLDGWESLTPSIDPRSRRRAALLDRDLDELGVRAGDRAPWPVSTGELGSLAAGLGCLYVLEGSTLGGRIVAQRARRVLGRQVPVAFFSSAGRQHLGADWSSLLAALDSFGAEHGVNDRRRAVGAACETFRVLGVALGAPEPAP
jgi:heme oxygenase